MLSENSPSTVLAPCCDVMRLSNLITVPDCYKSGNEELSGRVQERENWKQDGQESSATNSKYVFSCKRF